MWLLESDGAFQGRRLWLRPGKTYLFGRTAAEPGQLAISHNTISRKHLTITVGDVPDGYAQHPTRRSKLTIEDLATKIGTFVNGQKIKGEKHVVAAEEAELFLGKCPTKFRITWFPVVFTFSFTNKELQTQPLSVLRERFEQLDIKLLTDYSTQHTTHVVSKKRNTAKGLQALINGRHIVTETFLDAIVQAAEASQGAAVPEPSPLEQDFSAHWPDPLLHLPPPGGEPVQHADATYAPDAGRRDVFEGYTFVFYEKTQYNNLLAPITNGGGKALLEVVNAGEIAVDDFIRYVKGVAGEKGLGSFEDGSEGRGVVLVRYIPGKGEHVDWFTEFFREVSLRLDHRPIEQSEFLEAILIKDASILRRALEVESASQPADLPTSVNQQRAGDTSTGASDSAHENQERQSPRNEPAEVARLPPRRPRIRAPVKRRFAGFDDDDEEDMDEPASAPAREPRRQPVEEEEGLFVSQEASQDPNSVQPEGGCRPATASQRKRQASAMQEDDLMEGIAPAVDRFKRQRIESGREFATETPDTAAEDSTKSKAQPKKKIKKEIDILAVAAQHRQQEEARAQAEKEDLANLPDDVDLSEIRRLNIVEEIEVRQPERVRSREQDIVDGRWNPKWNGMKNFKKFRKRGEATGRQPARVIVPLTEAKNKEYGVGDDYWLEEEDDSQRKKTRAQSSGPGAADVQEPESRPASTNPRPKRVVGVVLSDSDGENEDSTMPEVSQLAQARSSRSSARTQQSAGAHTAKTAAIHSSGRSSQSQGKRPAADSTPEQPAKRQRQQKQQTRGAVEVADSDDSDDELKFRFGKRR